MNPTPAACLGIIANPSSGRDLRRLFSWGSTFSTTEKINAVLRLLSAGQNESENISPKVTIPRISS